MVMDTTTHAPGRTFLVFVLVSAGVVLLGLVLRLEAETGWTDLLHHNPHRPFSYTLFLPGMLFMTPLLFLVLSASGALLFAGLAAAVATRAIGRVPFWVAAALVPTCGLIAYTQQRWVDPDPTADPLVSMVLISAHLTPGLVGAWWLHRHFGVPPRVMASLDDRSR